MTRAGWIDAFTQMNVHVYPLDLCFSEQSTAPKLVDRELQIHGEAEGSEGLWRKWGQRPAIQLGPLSSHAPL